MGTVYKKTVTRKVPANAERFTKNGESFVRYTVRGRTRVSRLVVGEDGTERISEQSSTYIAKFKDGAGLVQEVSTGCRDKQAALSVLNGLMKRAELVKAKIMTSDQAKIADYQSIPLSQHIAEYVEHLASRKVHPDRRKTTKTRLIESSNGCGFRYLNDLNADALQNWLCSQMESKTRNMSAAVYNGYVELWVAFGNWCIGRRVHGKRWSMNGDKRLIANPFAGFGRLDEQSDRRRMARALKESELVSLLEAARKRPLEDAMTVRTGPNKGELTAKISESRRQELAKLGHERALIYKTAILTGLRLNEMRTLKVGDLSFGDVPFIRLQRSNEKNRKGSTVAMRSDLAMDLKAWCIGRPASDLVFRVPAGLLRIMNRDLIAAGIPKVDSEGQIVHVHALRHSFGTHLSIAGVAPRIAQAAMRHSDISLTMSTYVDARLLDTSAAFEALPSLPIGSSFVAPTVAPGPDKTSQNAAISDKNAEDEKSATESEKPCNSQGNTGVLVIGATGFEPATSTSRT